MLRPELTVVVPAWDIDGVLTECLASVAKGGEPCETVIVDNASARPMTAPVGTRLVRSDDRLTLGAARTLGLSHVRTPYVCFMDADDVLLPGALQLLCDALRAHHDALMSVGDILLWDPQSNVSVPSYVPSALARRLIDRPRLLAWSQAVRRGLPSAGAAVLRTAWLKQAGGYPDVVAGENWALTVSVCFAGRVRIVEQPMKLYRVDPSRPMLSVARDGAWSQGWAAHAAMRRALRRSLGDGTLASITAAALVPLHAGFVLWDALPRTPRHVRTLRRAIRRGKASPVSA